MTITITCFNVPMLALALYQPDIAPNTAAMIRLCACLGASLEIIEPCGFVWDEDKLKRVALDYVPLVRITRHRNFADFQQTMAGRRILLLSTKAAQPYTQFAFKADDVLMVGRESSGVPDDVHQAVTARLTIPMAHSAARSLNVVTAAAIVLAEARRQVVSWDSVAAVCPTVAPGHFP